MTVHQRLRLWADEIRAIANEGLHFEGGNPYSARRCRRLLRIAAELFALQDVREADEIERAYHADLGHLAPYPGGDAAIFDDDGQILLIRRRDNGLWAMPGGFFEVGETPAEGTCREAWEETGLEVEPVALSGVYDSRLCGTRSAHQLYQFVFLCRPRDEVVDEPGNLVAALAQRAQREADHVQAIEQILAKPAVADRVLELGVGGRDDANVDGER